LATIKTESGHYLLEKKHVLTNLARNSLIF